MDNVEFLWSCVREGKFSKESALELLDKRNEIFGDGKGNGGEAAREGHYTSCGQRSKDTVPKATFYSLGKHIPSELIIVIAS